MLLKKYARNKKFVYFLKIHGARYFAVLKVLRYLTRNVRKKIS